jgi:hypothetical protein
VIGSLERLPFDVGHDEVREAVGLTRVVQRQDVWVLESCGDLDLCEEPITSRHRGQFGLQDLDRYLALVLQVLRPGAAVPSKRRGVSEHDVPLRARSRPDPRGSYVAAP